MLQYKSNRFYTDQCSFKIPEGFYLNIDDDDFYEEDHIKLVSADLYYDVVILVDEEGKSAEEELNSVISEMKPKVISPVSAINVNELAGYQAMYKNKDGQYFEMWLDVNDEMTFMILVHTDENIEEIDLPNLVEQIDPRMI